MLEHDPRLLFETPKLIGGCRVHRRPANVEHADLVSLDHEQGPPDTSMLTEEKLTDFPLNQLAFGSNTASLGICRKRLQRRVKAA